MISCTEFVAAYSELFTYLDDHFGREEVSRLWDYLFAPTGDGIPLINYAKKDGLKGCVDYWTHIAEEESCDVQFTYNLEDGWYMSQSFHCPSKGRLLQLQKEIGLTPYKDYCDHCDYYRLALEEVGLTWIRNHMDVDSAQCSRVLWDTKKFKGIMYNNENTVVKRFYPYEHEYFHPDFHSSMNKGIEYVGSRHSEEDIKAYLAMFTRDVYKPVLVAMEQDPLGAIEAKIRETYKLEKSEDALTIVNDGKTLAVKVSYCPAVKHLHATGRTVSQWFHLSTETVMQTLADHAGLTFTMESYDAGTGAAAYSFTR